MSPILARVTRLALPLVLSGHASLVFAADCLSNFSVGTGPDKGIAFTGFATTTGSAPAAYAAVQAVLERNGWSVTAKDAASLAVVAQNSQRTASGRTGSLGLSFANVPGGVSLALVYNNPPGVESPASAVREHFCKIAGDIAAAAAATASTVAPPAAAGAPPLGPTPAGGRAASADASDVDGKLCLAGACLGMTAAQASALNLQPTGNMRFHYNPRLSHAYGLDAKGARIRFSDMGDMDSKLLSEFAGTVKTICAMSSASAQLKASDGQPIRLLFSPTIRNGRSVLVLVQIARRLPTDLSKSARERFEATARAQYGNAYVTRFSATPTRPIAGIDESGMSAELQLKLPHDHTMPGKLMEQPGCSAAPRLD
ncbi:hypothetical protein [Pseudoduganella lutea]|uniref:Uncharacterized protein n=1 Tax=Pseudoduganella lutea TaxID=321985 RepID=A0A4P6L647_9BURK|nr:hypothetical protein [Pseudoduganella lutea]QBE66954.1 hypothetical protein EWM63_31580 [Pseudoduganella lutea]